MKLTLFTADKTTNLWLLATYWSYVSLLLLFIFCWAVNEKPSWALLVFQLMPLLILVPGLLKQYPRAHSCLCFIIMPYFIAYAVEATSPIREISDVIGLLLTVIIFSGAMMASRGLQRLGQQ